MGAHAHARANVHRSAYHRRRHHLLRRPAQPHHGTRHRLRPLAALATRIVSLGNKRIQKSKRPGSSLCMSLRAVRLLDSPYLNITITSAYNVSDSMSATPMIKTMRIGPLAPGLRAIPSQAEAVALPWPMPQPSAATPKPNAAATSTRSTPGDTAPVVCANVTGTSTNTAARATANHSTFIAISVSPLYECAIRGWFPDTERPGSR